MSGVEWHRLVALREQRQRLAHQRVAAERHALAEADALAAGASGRRERLVALQRAQWHALVETMNRAASGVAQLGDSVAWRHAMDARIADAAVELKAAHDACERRRAALAAALAAWQRATADVQGAQAVSERVAKADARTRALRDDDRLDDAARQQWQAGRSTRASRT